MRTFIGHGEEHGLADGALDRALQQDVGDLLALADFDVTLGGHVVGDALPLARVAHLCPEDLELVLAAAQVLDLDPATNLKIKNFK